MEIVGEYISIILCHSVLYFIFHILLPAMVIVSEHKTRNHRNLQIPKVRLEYAKRSFYLSGVKNWNDIPGNI